MTARIRPGMGSRAEQLDALDRGLLETAKRVGAVEAELCKLRERVIDLAAAVAGQKVALRSEGVTEDPAHAPSGRGHLRVLNGGAR